MNMYVITYPLNLANKSQVFAHNAGLLCLTYFVVVCTEKDITCRILRSKDQFISLYLYKIFSELCCHHLLMVYLVLLVPVTAIFHQKPCDICVATFARFVECCFTILAKTDQLEVCYKLPLYYRTAIPR